MSLKEIRAVVETEVREFDVYFNQTFKVQAPLLNTVLRYIVKRKGKQIRPLFVFLSAGLSGKITDKTYRGAAHIELLHTATLIHDDVVDDSYQRRGFFSINALWKNKISVLVGDYLLSKGLLLSVEHKDYDLLEITSNAVRQMSEGELLQIEKARTLDIKEETYFKIIQMKTASLIESACAIGALSAGANDDTVKKMKDFGIFTGIAFQIKDDLLDYGSTLTGKPSGTDLKEKKLTIPLIYSLQEASLNEKRRIIRLISGKHNQKEVFSEVLEFINQYGGFEYSIDKMNDFKNKAINILHTFPESKYSEALIALLDFTINREN